MFSGFISHKHVVKSIGIHQRFDMAAYRAIEPFLEPDVFPPLDQILHFEGYYGPDGLKIKSPGMHEPSHLYDPASDTGEVPMHIENHYRQLVKSLQKHDLIRGAFEAGWLAHYVTDGLTPAHHFPLEEKLAELDIDPSAIFVRSHQRRVATSQKNPDKPLSLWRKKWATWGGKGLVSTHVNFEMGVATALLLYPLRAKLDHALLAKARRIGPLDYFKNQAKQIAKLDLYNQFYTTGWTAELANAVRRQVAPPTVQAVAIIWLLAYLEAGQIDLAGINFKSSPIAKPQSESIKSRISSHGL